MKKDRYISASLEIAPLDKNGIGEDNPKFRIVGNAGSRMEFWTGDVVIDMSSAENIVARKTPIPICYAHNLNDPIGVASEMKIEDGKVILEGEIVASSEHAKLFVESSKKGFPWEASLGFNVVNSTKVKKGEKFAVNGREEEGALEVAHKIEVWECSVVPYGADSNTESVVTAEKKMEDEKNVAPDNTAENKIIQDEPTVDIQRELEKLRKARSEENARIDAIEKIAKQYDNRDFATTAIEQGWSADKFELETLRAGRQNLPAIHVVDKSVDAKAVEAAFVRAAGYQPSEKKYGDQILAQADRLPRNDFRDLIEAGTGYQPTRAQMRDGSAWLAGLVQYNAAALTTHGLQSIFSTSANAVIEHAYGIVHQKWRDVYKIGSASDYKTNEVWLKNSDSTFKKRLPGGEYEQVRWSDEKWGMKIDEYGIQGSIDEQDIINGNALGVFSDTMSDLGKGAAKKINDLCWELFLAPPQISSTNFYSTNFGSLKASCALNFANLNVARVEFMKKTWGNSTDTKKANNVQKGEKIGYEPTILCVPTSLEQSARLLLGATYFNNGSTEYTAADYNPYKNLYKVVSVPELEANSSSTWYLMDDPSLLTAFEIKFLNGQQTPTLRQERIGVGALGIKFDGHFSFGVATGTGAYNAIMKFTA